MTDDPRLIAQRFERGRAELQRRTRAGLATIATSPDARPVEVALARELLGLASQESPRTPGDAT